MPKFKIKKRRKPQSKKITKCSFLKALQSSGGIYKTIAQRLNCSRETVSRWIKNKADEEALDAIKDEQDSVGDIAEETIKCMMKQRLDYGVASRTSRWFLERKHPNRGYKERKALEIEGGQNPLHIKNEVLLPLDTLDLPLDVRKKILEAMERKERENESNS